MSGKQKRSKWFASLTAEQRTAYVEKKIAEKADRPPSAEALEACARLDLATERGCFMREVPNADVQERLRHPVAPVPVAAMVDLGDSEPGELGWLRYNGLWPLTWENEI